MLCNVKEIFKVKKRKYPKGTNWVIELGKTDFCLFGSRNNKDGYFLFYIYNANAVMPQNVMFFAPDTRSPAQRSERQAGHPLSGAAARRDR